MTASHSVSPGCDTLAQQTSADSTVYTTPNGFSRTFRQFQREYQRIRKKWGWERGGGEGRRGGNPHRSLASPPFASSQSHAVVAKIILQIEHTVVASATLLTQHAEVASGTHGFKCQGLSCASHR